MAIRSIGWIIWIFVAVNTANGYMGPVSIRGPDPEVTVNGPRTDNSGWSVVESEQKFSALAGNGARVVVDRSSVAASRPAMLERQVVGAPSDVGDPILLQLLRLLPHTQIPNMAVLSLSPLRTDAEPNLDAGCEQQVAEQLSAETAVAAAVRAIEHSCDSQRQAAVGFIKDHIGEVLATHGWAHAVETQPGEVVQLSRLLAEQLTASSTPANVQTSTTSTTTTTTTTTSTSQPDGDNSGHDQTSDDAPTPIIRCPTTPLDDRKVSFFRMLPEEDREKMLIQAAQTGEVDDLRALLAAGASPTTRDIYRRTVLQWAAWRAHAEAASCLLDAGAPVDTTDDEWYTPLHMAAIGGNPDVVRLLAAWGADPNARDKWGWTPLHLTVRENKPEAALALLEAGADMEVKSNRGVTPLETARGEEYHNQLMADLLAQI